MLTRIVILGCHLHNGPWPLTCQGVLCNSWIRLHFFHPFDPADVAIGDVDGDLAGSAFGEKGFYGGEAVLALGEGIGDAGKCERIGRGRWGGHG